MILSLVELTSRVLGKYFLSMESLHFLPDELVEIIFNEYLRTYAQYSIITENHLNRIVSLLCSYHSHAFCTSFCYSTLNHLNFLTAHFYLDLLQKINVTLTQLDLSAALQKFGPEQKTKFLNLIGQMENLEYLRLTYNDLDDEDIRLLTASNRIRSKTLQNLHSLHLQGNHLTSRSGRFLNALTSLETLYVSHFVGEFDHLHVCSCAKNNVWNEIVNRGWIAKIPQLQSSTTMDNTFYRKRRRIDDENSLPLLKLVRFCSTCHPKSSNRIPKEEKKIVKDPSELIDRTQAHDLLAYYL